MPPAPDPHTAPRPPSPAEQIRFLRSLQRLLDEGSFTASYKYALLHAIADLCVIQGDDTGAALELGTDEIAERYIRLYWRQVAPFVGAEGDAVLRQNTGRRAAVIREIAERHERYQGSLPDLVKDDAEWDRVRREVERTVRRYPLRLLQNVGEERLDFLYALDEGPSRTVRLEPGVAYCFRAFYPLVTDMLRGAWAHFVQRQNPELLRQVIDLRSFLFGRERRDVTEHRRWLREVQEGRCFYCAKELRAGSGHVDHFISFRRYPLELGHNYVLADERCNGRKSDLLAAEAHLERWVKRNRDGPVGLAGLFDERGVLHDLGATERVARWAYGQVDRVGGQVWVREGELERLTGRWVGVLG